MLITLVSIIFNVILILAIVFLRKSFKTTVNRMQKRQKKEIAMLSARITRAESSKMIIDAISPLAFVKKMKGNLH